MAVKIRLKRMGKIRSPHYRVVVADSRTKRDGKVIEQVGKYHPVQEPSFIEINSERVQYWLSVGAQPTEQVLALLKLTGDWAKFRGEKDTASKVKYAQPKEAFAPDSNKASVVVEKPQPAKQTAEAVEEAQAAAEVTEVAEAEAAAAEDTAEGTAE